MTMTSEEGVQRPREHRALFNGVEEGHAGVELHVVGGAKHDVSACRRVGEGCPRDFAQARSQQPMRQIGSCLLRAAEPEIPGGPTMAETPELWKDEPHPVAALATGRHLRKRALMAAPLSVHEACEVMRIVVSYSRHHCR